MHRSFPAGFQPFAAALLPAGDPRGLEGGTLCQPGPADEAWGRTSPVLMLRL